MSDILKRYTDSELEALEKDALRYRWLRDHAQHSITLKFKDEDGNDRETCWSQIPRALDEQVDKAIGGHNGNC